ncbi:MAG: hypothetical protein HGA87_00750 [Desulfobulbaceae bacterium]|nr:hypothetical protein [Desulfobulbaceae bacterium]
MATSGSITDTKHINNNNGVLIEYTFAIDASGTLNFEPDWTESDLSADPYNFDGYASMQVVMTGATNGTLTVQMHADNSGTDANFLIPYNSDAIVWPAFCTALAFSTTPKYMKQINIPAAKRIKWLLTEAGGSAAVSGKLYLFLHKAKKGRY